MALHTVLRMFDARDTWDSYSEELEKYFEVNSVLNDNERVAILLTVLSPSVYKFLRDYCRPQSPRLKTYAELSELLRKHHSPHPSSLTIEKRIEFFSAMQAPTESVNDWHERVVKLAAFCDFGDQLDTILKDTFVSGLTDRRYVCRLSEESSSVTLADLVVLAENYALLCDTDATILDLPDEVLRQIILLLTARERLPLGNSCHRLRTLVFENPQLLRYLNFSKKAGLTTLTHIQRYFNNENACQHIRRVDVSNVDCMKAGDLLNNSIGKAINLVEVNIHGTRFEDICQLSSFLNLLQHLKKLSIDWPINDENDISLRRQILQIPFSKLTYLSVRLKKSALTMFTSYLSLCQQLEELYIQAPECDKPSFRINLWNSDIKQLKNLKIIQHYGGESMEFKEELATVLPDPERWTDFQLCGPMNVDLEGFYIEKDVEVCDELLQSRNLQEFLNTPLWWKKDFNLKWALNPRCLFKEVLRITDQDLPEDLCCLSTFERAPRYLLRVDEAKLLLKDPRYQMSYLYLNHRLERRCDAHLLAAALPNLSELVLYAVIRNSDTSPNDSDFQRLLSRRYGPVPEEQDDSRNLDPSFKMLVKNTPHLRHFTMDDKPWLPEWDMDALRLISGWQNLETLHLSDIPWKDGKFLIEIGKGCKNLQVLSLCNTFFEKETRSAQVAILQMLESCRNLRKLTLKRFHLNQAKMFALLAKNVKLEKVEIINSMTQHSAAPWISSLENMIRQCVKLTTIICETNSRTHDDLDEAESAVKRIREECHRPDFQMNVTCYCGG